MVQVWTAERKSAVFAEKTTEKYYFFCRSHLHYRMNYHILWKYISCYKLMPFFSCLFPAPWAENRVGWLLSYPVPAVSNQSYVTPARPNEQRLGTIDFNRPSHRTPIVTKLIRRITEMKRLASGEEVTIPLPLSQRRQRRRLAAEKGTLLKNVLHPSLKWTLQRKNQTFKPRRPYIYSLSSCRICIQMMWTVLYLVFVRNKILYTIFRPQISRLSRPYLVGTMLPGCFMNEQFWSEYSGPIMNISATFLECFYLMSYECSILIRMSCTKNKIPATFRSD